MIEKKKTKKKTKKDGNSSNNSFKNARRNKGRKNLDSRTLREPSSRQNRNFLPYHHHHL